MCPVTALRDPYLPLPPAFPFATFPGPGDQQAKICFSSWIRLITWISPWSAPYYPFRSRYHMDEVSHITLLNQKIPAFCNNSAGTKMCENKTHTCYKYSLLERLAIFEIPVRSPVHPALFNLQPESNSHQEQSTHVFAKFSNGGCSALIYWPPHPFSMSQWQAFFSPKSSPINFHHHLQTINFYNHLQTINFHHNLQNTTTTNLRDISRAWV